MGSYKSITQMGGESGKVYKATEVDSERIFAIKKIGVDPDIGILQSTVREIRALKRLKSKYVLELEDVLMEKGHISLVLEYVPFSLSVLISQGFNFTKDHISSIVFQLLRALDYIHSAGMIHRDLNPSHVLLDSCGRVKIAGLGLSRYRAERMTSCVCSLWYRAPELLLGDISYTNKVDSWSVACIVLEIGNRSPVFNSMDDISQCKAVLSALGSPEVEYPWNGLFRVDRYAKKEPWNEIIQNRFGGILDHDLLHVIGEMLVLNKHKRLSVHNALKFPSIRQGEKLVCSYQSERIND